MSEHATAGADASSQVENAVAQGGAYEVLRKRLGEQGARLRALSEALNAHRLAAFGGSELEVIGRLRIRTENNCVGRDIVQVGDCAAVRLQRVLRARRRRRASRTCSACTRWSKGAGRASTSCPSTWRRASSAKRAFVRDFNELYAYYKHARLLQLACTTASCSRCSRSASAPPTCACSAGRSTTRRP